MADLKSCRLINADALCERMYHDAFETDSDMQKWDSGCWIRYKMFEKAINDAIQEQPTICGYSIENLVQIATLLQKENLSPERVGEALTDIGSIVAIVKAEYDEALRNAVEHCTI